MTERGFMLATEKLLQALQDTDNINGHLHCDDHSLEKVLELYIEPDKPDCEVICSDGQKRSLLFNG